MEVTDRIYIRDLRLRCIIGIYEEERREKQDVVINVVLHTSLARPGVSDDIADAVNYKTIKKRIIGYVESSRNNLIEKLAEDIAAICLEDARVVKVQVTVDKPMALRFARSVAVEIVRSRDGGAP